LAVSGSLVLRRALLCAAGTLVVVIAVIAALGAGLDSGLLRGPFIRMIASRTARRIEVGGVLEMHVFSLHPRLMAERVTIGNPPWMPAGSTAKIGKLSLSIEMPGFGHSFQIETLEMDAASLQLARDSSGHANWQWTDPALGSGRGLPIIRSLSVPDAHVELDDVLRHLKFEGTVSAHDVKGTAAAALRIEGAGQLNGRAANFKIDGDPLAAADHAKPYHFTYTETSSGSRLTGDGVLPRPFDFNELDATFDAAGTDLKDLYFLTGVTLVNTGSYRLSGTLARRGYHTKFSHLVLNSGQSDARGTVSVDTSGGRPTFDADLNSQTLHLADIGARAAGRDPEASTEPPMLLSKAQLTPSAVRRSDGVAHFHAQQVVVGHIPLQELSAQLTVNHGVLVLAALSAEILTGKLAAHGRLDATTDNPAADIDLEISGLQVGKLFHEAASGPPMDGLLQVRVAVKGHGSSLHQVAASADGAASAVLAQGSLRASLAELAGSELRGLGLLLDKSAKETAVHCGVAGFAAHDGVLAARILVIDTDPALIIGDGTIHMDSEALDLSLRGQSKGRRVIPSTTSVLVHGTLAHPSMEIQGGKSIAQSAGTAALNVLLTPLAPVLAFLHRGRARDADCGTLLDAASSVH
jgi:AsmA family protein